MDYDSGDNGRLTGASPLPEPGTSSGDQARASPSSFSPPQFVDLYAIGPKRSGRASPIGESPGGPIAFEGEPPRPSLTERVRGYGYVALQFVGIASLCQYLAGTVLGDHLIGAAAALWLFDWSALFGRSITLAIATVEGYGYLSAAAIALLSGSGLIVALWGFFFAKRTYKSAKTLKAKFTAAAGLSRTVAILVTGGVIAGLTALVWRAVEPQIKRIVRKMWTSKAESSNGMRKVVQNVVDMVVVTMAGVGVASGSLSLLHSARFFAWLVPFFERLCRQGRKAFVSTFVVADFKQKHRLWKRTWFGRQKLEEVMWGALPEEMRHIRFLRRSGDEDTVDTSVGSFDILVHPSDPRWSTIAVRPFFHSLLKTVDPGQPDEIYMAAIVDAFATAHHPFSPEHIPGAKAAFSLAVRDATVFSSYATLVSAFGAISTSAVVVSVIAALVFVLYKVAIRVHSQFVGNASEGTFTAADIDDVDDDAAFRSKRKMKWSRDPAVIDTLMRLKQADDARVGDYGRESVLESHEISCIIDAVSGNKGSLLSVVAPIILEYLSDRPEGEDAFAVALGQIVSEGQVDGALEAEVPSAPRLNLTASGIRAYAVRFPNGDEDNRGVGSFVSIESHTVFVTAKHVCGEDLTVQGMVDVEGRMYPLRPIGAIHDVMVCDFPPELVPRVRVLRFGKTRPAAKTPIIRLGPNEISMGHVTGDKAGWAMNDVHAVAATYTSMPGDSGSPILLGTTAGNATLIGIHACSDKPGHTNGFWEINSGVVAGLGAQVRRYFDRPRASRAWPTPISDETVPKKKARIVAATAIRESERLIGDMTAAEFAIWFRNLPASTVEGRDTAAFPPGVSAVATSSTDPGNAGPPGKKKGGSQPPGK